MEGMCSMQSACVSRYVQEVKVFLIWHKKLEVVVGAAAGVGLSQL